MASCGVRRGGRGALVHVLSCRNMSTKEVYSATYFHNHIYACAMAMNFVELADVLVMQPLQSAYFKIKPLGIRNAQVLGLNDLDSHLDPGGKMLQIERSDGFSLS